MLILLLGLAAVYAFYFTGWFKPKIIQISHTSRVFDRRVSDRARLDPPMTPITFSVEPPCRITELKVVPLAAWQTNQNTLPLWHLIATSNSAPIKIFIYGQRLRGLKPAIPGTEARLLQPGVTYRLLLTAGRAKGQHDFEIKPAD